MLATSGETAATTTPRAALGFTLIELLAALLVITLLAATAYPSYSSYVQRSVRAQAQQTLLDLSIVQQQRLLQYGAYLELDDTAAVSAQLSVPDKVAENYTLSVSYRNASRQQFVATATPLLSGQMSADSVLAIDEQGNRSPVELW
ncbi:prepilin-type N-terminal cleavage/methylation domain-containing protein [Gammaproteobacteria bacterium LSUCC0057]|uniref:Prepilin-type N-terminal cleavage/methylation domain-containing protein n=1 Tax=Gammaproteobacteria bacterium LSUCC0057 TaxID=2559237 RepID=A0A4Y8UFW3_9GAMM|nr:prepilin-type N-terminal cleavage/methylation domain-containing protein [Gammaproteobacteria bacterium LSUCC0057]